MRRGQGAGRRAGPPDPATLTRIADLRREVEVALAALAEAVVEGEDADEIADVLEALRRRARRWRLTEARLRAAAPVLLAALSAGGVPARDARAWIDTDAQMLIVLADWPGVTAPPSWLEDATRRIAESLDIEAAAVQVATVGALRADLLERVWAEGHVLGRYA